jgi:hypothetical protein
MRFSESSAAISASDASGPVVTTSRPFSLTIRATVILSSLAAASASFCAAL